MAVTVDVSGVAAGGGADTDGSHGFQGVVSARDSLWYNARWLVWRRMFGQAAPS
jgi:hypothetical protein